MYRIGSAEVMVEFRAETARIDLNLSPKPVLAGLFVALGVQGDAAEGYADRIVAWRTPLASGANDTEGALYRGKSYGPRHGPFEHVNELALLAGFPPALVDCALALCDGLQRSVRDRRVRCLCRGAVGVAGNYA